MQGLIIRELRQPLTASEAPYEPCLPKPAKAPPAGPGWIHEIKHDGFRIVARLQASRVRLSTAAVATISRRASPRPWSSSETDAAPDLIH